MKLDSIRISTALGIVGQTGIFSNQDFKSGDIVLSLSGEVLPMPTRTSIKVAEEKHIEDSVGNFINHNCKPSCKINGIKVIALRDIKSGEEITFDYSKNEDKLANPFICSCCNRLIS
jgi:hypothetical protein